MTYEEKIGLVPVDKKVTLNLDEAVAYTGIGRDRLCKLADKEDCDFILWVGQKRLFKRKQLEDFIAKAYSI